MSNNFLMHIWAHKLLTKNQTEEAENQHVKLMLKLRLLLLSAGVCLAE